MENIQYFSSRAVKCKELSNFSPHNVIINGQLNSNNLFEIIRPDLIIIKNGGLNSKDLIAVKGMEPLINYPTGEHAFHGEKFRQLSLMSVDSIRAEQLLNYSLIFRNSYHTLLMYLEMIHILDFQLPFY